MTTKASSKISFEDYLAYDDGTGQHYEWVEGVLLAMLTESEFNAWLSFVLQLYLVSSAQVKPRLTQRYSCELEVPVLKPKQPRNRFPDLVILCPEHLELTQRRLTIRLKMPPPLLVMEAVSPGKTNRDRDYQDKHAQYQARAIPEYWLIDPEPQRVTVLRLVEGEYEETLFQDSECAVSPTFPEFSLTAEQVLRPQE